MRKQKGNIAAITMMFIGIVIAVALVSNVVMTTVFNPMQSVSTPVANSTTITSLNASTFKAHNFTASNIDNTRVGSLVVAYQGSSKAINVTVNGITVGNFTGTSPDTFAVPATITLTNPTTINYTFTQNIGGVNATNVTSATFTYYQKGGYYGWDSGTQAMWLIVGIAVVAALLLFIFGGRR
jgi:hypothetical protein